VPTVRSPGAFIWGVLDRLLDEERLAIEGVTATSAGAMNGAMLTTGLKIGGAAEAKRCLAACWALLASACLPFLYQAVRIDGQGYEWFDFDIWLPFLHAPDQMSKSLEPRATISF
jgi:predicted acylesterase/phospholipase RssA